VSRCLPLITFATFGDGGSDGRRPQAQVGPPRTVDPGVQVDLAAREDVLIPQVGRQHVHTDPSGRDAPVVLAGRVPLQATATVLVCPRRPTQVGIVGRLNGRQVVVDLDVGPGSARHVDTLAKATVVSFATSVFALGLHCCSRCA